MVFRNLDFSFTKAIALNLDHWFQKEIRLFFFWLGNKSSLIIQVLTTNLLTFKKGFLKGFDTHGQKQVKVPFPGTHGGGFWKQRLR